MNTAVRLSSGIPEFDALLHGGIPEDDSLLMAGPSGSGKSVINTHFIAEGSEPLGGYRGLTSGIPGPWDDEGTATPLQPEESAT